MKNNPGHKVEEISAVVPCLNSIDSIEPCLKSLRACGVGQIIVVDGGSSDGTAEIAMRYADNLLSDEGIGLGNARNIGIRSATGRYILNSGPDNAYDKNTLLEMLAVLATTSVGAVSCKTRINSTGYLARLLNIRGKARVYAGERDSIGTPMLCDAKTIKAHPFDETLTWSDDAELCARWKANLGARFFIADVDVEEVGDVNFAEVRERWSKYGISDWEVYTNQSPGWKLSRKMQSILYPLKQELVLPLFSRKISFVEKISVTWFLVYITVIRYVNWVKAATKTR